MCANWTELAKKVSDDPVDKVRELIKEMSASASESGGFDAFRTERWLGRLNSAIGLNPEIPVSLREQIVFAGSCDAFKGATPTPATLLQCVTRREQEWLSKKPKEWIMASTVSIQLTRPVRRKVHGCQIAFSTDLPSRFDRTKGRETLQRWGMTCEAEGYAAVRVRARARDAHEAFDRAMDALDLIRGIWNFIIPGSLSLGFGGPRFKASHFDKGPLHTMHLPDGAEFSQFWYEPGFQHRPPVPWTPEGGLQRNERKIRRLLRRSKYADDLERAFRHYCTGLDQVDYNNAFLRLWGVLEELTGRPEQSTMSRRVSSLCSRRAEARAILDHLRDVRNGLVHRGHELEKAERLLFLLREFVDVTLRFHLTKGSSFSSIEEASSFLDLSTDEPELRKQIAWRSRRLGRTPHETRQGERIVLRKPSS